MAAYSWQMTQDEPPFFDVTGLHAGNDATNSSSRLDILPGDTLTFSKVGIGTYTISSFVNGFTSTANITDSGTRTVATSFTENFTFYLTITRSGYNTVTLYFRLLLVPSQIDQFTLGPDITNALTNSVYNFAGFSVTGMSVGDTQALNGSGLTFRYLRNGSWSIWSTSHTVQAGDWVSSRMTSSPSTTTTLTGTLSATGIAVSDSASITTGSVGGGTLVPFPISSGVVSMLDVANFFAGPKTSVALSDYYRGGTYVPDLVQNQSAGFPASGQISLSNFYTSYTNLFWVTAPVNQTDAISSVFQGTVSASVTWYKITNFEIGYGPDMEDACEYRFTHTEGSWIIDSDWGNDLDFQFAGVSLTKGQGVYQTAWGYTTGLILCALYATGYTIAQYTGYVTIEVRNQYNPGYVLSTTVQYSLEIMDPID